MLGILEIAQHAMPVEEKYVVGAYIAMAVLQAMEDEEAYAR